MLQEPLPTILLLPPAPMQGVGTCVAGTVADAATASEPGAGGRSPLQELAPILTPSPRSVQESATLQEFAPITTPAPLPEKLQLEFGTALPPQEVGWIEAGWDCRRGSAASQQLQSQ